MILSQLGSHKRRVLVNSHMCSQAIHEEEVFLKSECPGAQIGNL